MTLWPDRVGRRCFHLNLYPPFPEPQTRFKFRVQPDGYGFIITVGLTAKPFSPHLWQCWQERHAFKSLEMKRKIVLGLVRRVEIHKDEIVVVFRVDPQPQVLDSENSNDSGDGVKSMQHCRRRNG